MPVPPSPVEPLDPELSEKLKGISTATLATQLFKRGFRTRFVTGALPIKPGQRMVGVARTLRYIPAREDIDVLESFRGTSNFQRVAVESIQPGEVLVIDARGDSRAATLGAILATRMQVRGAAGIVTDGPVRDYKEIAALDIPVYTPGPHANTNLTMHHAADIDLPIGCGGVMVVPGDVVVGDDDGVMVIPRHLVEEVVRDAWAQEEEEAWITGRIRSGAGLFGTYPMNEETREAYMRWRQSQGR